VGLDWGGGQLEDGAAPAGYGLQGQGMRGCLWAKGRLEVVLGCAQQLPHHHDDVILQRVPAGHTTTPPISDIGWCNQDTQGLAEHPNGYPQGDKPQLTGTAAGTMVDKDWYSVVGAVFIKSLNTRRVGLMPTRTHICITIVITWTAADTWQNILRRYTAHHTSPKMRGPSKH